MKKASQWTSTSTVVPATGTVLKLSCSLASDPATSHALAEKIVTLHSLLTAILKKTCYTLVLLNNFNLGNYLSTLLLILWL